MERARPEDRCSLSSTTWLRTGDSRVGALAFGTDLSGPRRIVPWAKTEGAEDDEAGEDLDLAGMIEAVRELNTAQDLPMKHRRFLMLGSSLGGQGLRQPRSMTAGNGLRSLDAR